MGTLLFSSSFSLIEFSVKSIFGSLDTVGSLLPGFATMDVVVGSQVAETGCAIPTKPGHHQFTVAVQPMSPLEPSVCLQVCPLLLGGCATQAGGHLEQDARAQQWCAAPTSSHATGTSPSL
jgi:hypothetical protein